MLNRQAVGLSRSATHEFQMPDSVTDDSGLTTGRSLVAMAAPAGVGAVSTHSVRPSAVFLAQLVATAQGAPQTRARRRATADRAASHYAAAGRRKVPSMVKVSM
jgi:hypothetical protein